MAQPNSDILASADTRIGRFVLRRRTPQADPEATFVELLVDDLVLMSGYNTLSERALARLGIDRCAGERLRVLVGGLGLGHTAHEALRSPRVATVDVIEFVPEVIAWFERDLIPLAPELRADPRFQVILDDVYGRLALPPAARYDVLLVDVDHAPHDPIAADGGSAMFYTADGLRRVARHLEPGGILAVWSYAASPDFEAVLRDVFSTVEVETTRFEDDLFGEPDETNWLFFASGPRPE